MNGPALQARGSQVAVAWFTGANDRPQVRCAVSSDGGRTFAKSFVVDADSPLGRVDVGLLADGSILVSSVGKPGPDGRAPLHVRCYEPGSTGNAVAAVDVTHVSASRSSSFPTLAVTGGGALVAWSRDGHRIGVAIVRRSRGS